jgi:uncharacterized cofD-like protein
MNAIEPTTVVDLMDEMLRVERDGPRIVAIGGGTGLPQALRAVQRYAGNITAIVSVADDGGSSGRLRADLGIPPPGDIRRCLLALAAEDSPVREVFEHRFTSGDLAGHSLGNLIIAALAEHQGSFEQALDEAGRLLRAAGTVLPAATEPLQLEAVVDGAVRLGQVAIARGRGTISKLRVIPESVSASPAVVEAIAAADQIVLGPGSLFTSVIATLIVPGIADAVNAARARLDYVCNLTTQDGETLGMDGADHIDALLRMTGLRPPAAIVAHRGDIPTEPPIRQVEIDPEVLATYGVDVVIADLADPVAEWPRHDPARLGAVLGRLI